MKIRLVLLFVSLALFASVLPLLSQDKDFETKDAVPPQVLQDEHQAHAVVPKVVGLPPAAEAAMKQIDAERIRAHVHDRW